MSYKSIVLSGNPGAGKSALGRSAVERVQLANTFNRRIWREKYEAAHPNKEYNFSTEFWSKTSMERQQEVNDIAKVIFEKGNAIRGAQVHQESQSFDMPACLA